MACPRPSHSPGNSIATIKRLDVVMWQALDLVVVSRGFKSETWDFKPKLTSGGCRGKLLGTFCNSTYNFKALIEEKPLPTKHNATNSGPPQKVTEHCPKEMFDKHRVSRQRQRHQKILIPADSCKQKAQEMYSQQSALAAFVPAMNARLAATSTEQPVAPDSLRFGTKEGSKASFLLDVSCMYLLVLRKSTCIMAFQQWLVLNHDKSRCEEEWAEFMRRENSC